MSTTIDEMIDIISSDMPEFLDHTKPEDRDMFTHISNMIIMSKILSIKTILSIKLIDEFTESFQERFISLLDCSENIEKINISYDYVSEFYLNILNYLINIEEYEMCSNFRSFIDAFNEKNKDNEL